LQPPRTRGSVITLTTDFGLKDPYVASMKGVILSLAPEARIVDISHEVPPQGIVEGGFTLACAFPHFPKGTIHVLVVDPGVGTSRRLLLARTENHFFLAPDNGALGLVFDVEPPREIREISAIHYSRPEVSPTFHGRDILAPAAARLARGTLASHLGDPTQEFVPSPLPPPEPLEGSRLRLRVITADRFGNLILNLRQQQYHELAGASSGERFSLEIASRRISRLVRTYGEAAPRELVALFNSSGYVEVAVREGSAARTLACGAGAEAILAF